jgi:diguanylate cyclase (GGDEF)-like protein/PAS domain S-box-containing protein
LSQHGQKHPSDRHLRRSSDKPGSESGTTLAARPAAELLHELQVYQIELETQNEVLKQSQFDLEQSRDRFVDFYEVSPVGYITLNEDGMVVDINLTGAKHLGLARVEIVNTYFSRLLLPEEANFWHLHFIKLLGQSERMDCEVRLRRGDGKVLDVRLDSLPLVRAGRPPQVRMVMTDITLTKQSEEDLRIAAIAFESQEGMFITNADKVILRVNKAFSKITGYDADEVVGHASSVLRNDLQDVSFYDAMWAEVASEGGWQGEILNRRKSGEVFPEWFTITAVKNHAGETSHYVATFTDITSHKAAESQIKSLAFYDSLTGLPNRRLLLDRLEHALAIGTRQKQYGALLFVDLDNFKTLNDTRGHYKGDLLLKQVATRLTHCVRGVDTVARLGGDEFVVMLEDLGANVAEAVCAAQAVAEKILFALNQRYQLATYSYQGTASIGITLFGDQPERIDEPLKRADLAMYQAKAAGRNGLSFFDPQMQAIVSARAALETGLQGAVERGEFRLHYQAQMIGTEQLTGVEALVRWQPPGRGTVSPGEFIPVAEESGLILPLGKWVLETACAQLAAWANRPEMAHLTIAVNVSARQFHQSDFVEQVLMALAGTGANPNRLKLELTESLLVSNVEQTIAKMASLKGVGVAFSLDDFGTGYSSLAYLKRLPLAQLKIDQGFIRDILTDPNDAAIAKMVIVLADSLGLSVIAEGVETEAQRELLAQQGCHAYQGYLFSRPLPIDEFEIFAAKHR